MDDEDDFGDLYGSQGPNTVTTNQVDSLQGAFPGYDYYDEDEEEDFDFTSIPSQTKPVFLSKTPENFPLDGALKLGVQDSDDEDEEELIVLGYHGDHGLGRPLMEQSSSRAPEGNGSTHLTVKSHHDTQAAEFDNLGEGYPELTELDSVEGVAENGVLSPLAAAEEDLTGFAPAGVLIQSVINNSISLDDPERSPDVGDFTNHTVTIPGLSTNPTMSSFGIEANGDAFEDDWDGRDAGKEHLQGDRGATGEGGDDWDSDSEDDLRIVVNNDHLMYSSAEKGAVRGFQEDSEDEDEEGLIIVAGGEPVDDQEWGEEQPLPPEGAQAVPGDGSTPPVGDRQGLPGDEKGQLEKGGLGVGASQAAQRSSYGYHSYHSPFKYVRPGAAPLYGGAVASAGQPQSSRVSLSKGGSGRGDWGGAGRGSYGSQRMPQVPPWGSGASHGFQFGYEFSLPPSKTVFDIDLESFDEKPWRHPSVDTTDFFNFGFNENSWKDYCKQLAQLKLESTMQSKIRVYESGRSEQEYDPDLPPELAVARGLYEAGDRNQQRQTETEATAAAAGRSRGHTQVIPTGRAIQVEGGLGDRRPSADLRRQRIRDCDTIILVDAMEEERVNIQGIPEETQERRDEEGEDKDEDEEEVRPNIKPKPQQHLWCETERVLGGRKNIPKGSGFLPRETFRKAGEIGARPALDSDEMATHSIDHVVQVGQPSVAAGFSMFSGESVDPPQISRDRTSRPSTPPGIVTEEKRDTEIEPSHSSGLCQDTQSILESLNDDDESYVKMHINSGEKIQSPEVRHARDYATSDKDQNVNDQPVGQGLNDGRRSSSREVLIQDSAPEGLQHDNPGFSPKRERLPSPDGSQTASKDDFDIQISTRSVILKKESEDSGEYSKEALEDDEEAPESRKVKRHCNLGRENQHQDYVEGARSHHRKKSFSYSRQELEREIESRTDKTDEHRKRAREESTEKTPGKELLKDWQDREDGVYGRRKEREGEARRKDYLGKEGTNHKERGGNVDRQELRKRDDEDRRRDRLDRGVRHREREGETSNWRNVENRRREEEYRKKDRSGKEEVAREQKTKEKHGADRHDRDVDLHYWRKEEESRRRDRVEENRRPKAREGSWREREDAHRRNGVYQDLHGRIQKDEERSGQIGRSRRHTEDRSWLGRDESRAKESSRAAEPRDHTREKRKHVEDYGKDRDRSHEGRARPFPDREDSHFPEELKTDEEKFLRYGGSLDKRNKPSDDQRGSGVRLQSEKQKSDVKKKKDSDKETNDSSSLLAECSDSSRKRKTANSKFEKVGRRSSEDPVLGNFSANRTDLKVSHHQEICSDQLLRTVYNDSVAEKFPANEESSQVAEIGSSEDDKPKYKGRSKLERWTSHKDLGVETSHKLSSQIKKLRKADRHHGTLRSEPNKHQHDNHKVRVGRTNNDSDRDDKKTLDMDRNPGKESVCQEQEGGWGTDQDEKWESAGQNHRTVGSVDDKCPGEHHEQIQHPPMQRLDMAAKLEKRKERFKLPMEDRELARKLENEDDQLLDKEEAKQERPARKRRWASG